jgi:hypothetical protein
MPHHLSSELPLLINDLPDPVRILCEAFVTRLKDIIPANLHGVYLYGAAVFPDAGPVQDVDCFVILKTPLSKTERDELLSLHEEMTADYPPLGAELDTYFILHEEAVRQDSPTHQLRPAIRDYSWALHCAHIQAKKYLTLFGPEPKGIFPRPTADRIVAALGNELAFINANFKYPDYCVLNLCRIMYSLKSSDVVVSKRFSGKWAAEQYAQWADLITAAGHSYDGTASEAELEKLNSELAVFHECLPESPPQRTGAVRSKVQITFSI